MMNNLPHSVVLSLNDLASDLEYDDLDDFISEWLTYTYGFCHYGFNYTKEGDNIHITDILWDTEG